MEPIKIVFSFDENFTDLFAVALKSLLESNKEDHIELYIMYEQLEDKTKENLLRIVKPYHQCLHFIKFDAFEYDSLQVNNHLNKATYFRLAIPKHLAFNKVIYLDSDLLIMDSIRELWEIDLDDFYFAACETTGLWNPELGLDQLGYCNTGVMVMNLDRWRSDNFSERVMDFLLNRFYLTWFSDQCAINYVAQGNWKRIPLKFNLTTDVYLFKIARKDNHFSRLDIEYAKSNPVIIHFSGPSKPNRTSNSHPYKKLFWKILRQTPYSRRLPKDFSILNQIRFFFSEKQRQQIRNLMRKIRLLK